MSAIHVFIIVSHIRVGHLYPLNSVRYNTMSHSLKCV